MDKKEFIKLILKARRYQEKAILAEQDVFDFIGQLTDIDLEDIPFSAENSDNLKEAITCFISYGESDEISIADKLDEIIKNENHKD